MDQITIRFSEDLFSMICEGIADGKSVRAICAKDGMPSQDSFYRWLRECEGLSERYARAREAQADLFADEIIEIADNTDDPAKARVQIDVRKWRAAKLAPKRYGDKVELEHSGEVNTINKIELVAPDRHDTEIRPCYSGPLPDFH